MSTKHRSPNPPGFRILLSGTLLSATLLTGCDTESSGPTPFSRLPMDPALEATASPGTLFLHGVGATANPPRLILDAVAPTATTAKYKDSPSIRFNGGNPYVQAGGWTAAPAAVSGSLTALGDAHVWLGLKNSDDIGTRFDVRVEAYKNGSLVTSGESRCIQGLTQNASLARDIAVSFDPFSPADFDGTSDVFSLKVLTRIGTTGAGAFCGGHSNAVGLRLYFDAANRPANVALTISPTASCPPGVTDLGTLGGTYSEGQGINVHCQVVGSSTLAGDLTNHAYLWHSGVMTDIGTLGGTFSTAASINDNGQVVGSSALTGDTASHAFLWQNGTMIDLGTLGGSSSSALDINNNGQVVGVSDPGDGSGHAFLWQNGTMMDLGDLGQEGAVAFANNDLGHVVGIASTTDGGNHAFLWQNGTMTDLGTLSSAGPSTAQGVNNNDQVVGVDGHAFLWQNGTMTDLGTLSGYEEASFAESINDNGEIAGWSRAVSGRSRAFLWRNGMMIELPTLGGDLQGYGNDINANGDVVGQSYLTGNAVVHATLWSGF
jgi:probable HAF family extracellular repeat protein